MELIQSFIAIPEAALKQQALQKNPVLLFNKPSSAVQSTIQMELVQSFIAIPEAAVKQQDLQKNIDSTIAAYQAPQSQELTPVQVLLFNKPNSAVQSTIQDDAACPRAV
jgi:hypothetical protein